MKVSQFELDRLERIKRNNEYLAQLGLNDESPVMKRRKKRRKKKIFSPPIRRRSPRLRHIQPESKGLEKKLTRSKKKKRNALKRVNRIRDTLEHARDMQQTAFALAADLETELNQNAPRALTDKPWAEQVVENEIRDRRTTSFRIGDRVAVRYRGGPDWFECFVVSANADGSYDIRYPDGDTEHGVTNIRSLPPVKKMKTKTHRRAHRKIKSGRLIMLILIALFVFFFFVKFLFWFLSLFVGGGGEIQCIVPSVSSIEGVKSISCGSGHIVNVGTVCDVEPLEGYGCVDGICETSCLENGEFKFVEIVIKEVVDDVEIEDNVAVVDKEVVLVDDVAIKDDVEVESIVMATNHHVVDTVSIPEKVLSSSDDDNENNNDVDTIVDKILDDVRRERMERKEEERLLIEKQKKEDEERRRVEVAKMQIEERRKKIQKKEEEKRRIEKLQIELEERLKLEQHKKQEEKTEKQKEEEEEGGGGRENLPAELDIAEETPKWISEKWNERASFARVLLNLDECKYLIHFFGKASSEDCAALSLSHNECGFTPSLSKNDERPLAGDVIRYVWSGGKGCFCCSKSTKDSIDASWFVSKVKHAGISLEMYETCVDTHVYCSPWAKGKQCENDSFRNFMYTNCRHSCGLCSADRHDDVVVAVEEKTSITSSPTISSISSTTTPPSSNTTSSSSYSWTTRGLILCVLYAFGKYLYIRYVRSNNDDKYNDKKEDKTSALSSSSNKYPRRKYPRTKFVETSIPRDGNCIFKSVAVHWPDGDHRELRRHVVRWLRTHKDTGIEKMKLIEWLNIPGSSWGDSMLPPGFKLLGDEDRDVQRYLDYISRDTNWGGMVEILAFDHIVGKDIVVLTDYDKNNLEELFRSRQTNRGEIFVHYNGTNHFSQLDKTNNHNQKKHEKKERKKKSSPRIRFASPLRRGDAVRQGKTPGTVLRVHQDAEGAYYTIQTPKMPQGKNTIRSRVEAPYRSLFDTILDAQDGVRTPQGCATFAVALSEMQVLKQKRKHYAWYIWPTLSTLRPTTKFPEFLLPNIDAFQMYLWNRTLRSRVLSITDATISAASVRLTSGGGGPRDALIRVLGNVDERKFHESLTLLILATVMTEGTVTWRGDAFEILEAALSWGYSGILNRNAIRALETSGYPRARGIRTIQDMLNGFQ